MTRYELRGEIGRGSMACRPWCGVRSTDALLHRILYGPRPDLRELRVDVPDWFLALQRAGRVASGEEGDQVIKRDRITSTSCPRFLLQRSTGGDLSFDFEVEVRPAKDAAATAAARMGIQRQAPRDRADPDDGSAASRWLGGSARFCATVARTMCVSVTFRHTARAAPAPFLAERPRGTNPAFLTGMNTLESDLEQLALLHPDLAASLRPVDGLSPLLAWCVREGVDARGIDIIIQDEYTHDAILAWRDRFVVFGLT